jgi:hypothetical protein
MIDMTGFKCEGTCQIKHAKWRAADKLHHLGLASSCSCGHCTTGCSRCVGQLLAAHVDDASSCQCMR